MAENDSWIVIQVPFSSSGQAANTAPNWKE